jgi:hypothetical protein
MKCLLFFPFIWGPILACLEQDTNSRFGFADPSLDPNTKHCVGESWSNVVDVSGRTVTGTEMAGLGYINGLFLAGRLMEETFPRIRDEHPHSLHLFHCFFLSVSY